MQFWKPSHKTFRDFPNITSQCITWYCRGASENSKDRRVAVVIGHSIDRAKTCQVIFVGSIIAMPGNHIEGGEVLPSRKKKAVELDCHSEADLCVFKGSNGGLKITGIGQSICSCSMRCVIFISSATVLIGSIGE